VVAVVVTKQLLAYQVVLEAVAVDLVHQVLVRLIRQRERELPVKVFLAEAVLTLVVVVAVPALSV
jgi:hypothetical protein